MARNYGLGVVFLTPLALLLSDLASPSPAGALVEDRALSSLLGIAIALACALLVVHDHAAVRAVRALAACTEASERAGQVLDDCSAPSYPIVQTHLAAAVVELREADDAAGASSGRRRSIPPNSPPRSSVPAFSWSGSSEEGDATRSAARARFLIQGAGPMVTLTCFMIGWSLWVL